jgi:hypothetical protein
MASTDIRQFLFYFKYLWSPEDFGNLQDWLEKEFRGIAEGGFGSKAILSGLNCVPGGGMTVTVPAGIAIDSTGRIVVTAAATSTIASPSGNPAKSLIILRPKLIDMTDIPEPINPGNDVPLHQQLSYDLMVLDGTPAAVPAYPTTQANDIIICALVLADGHATILTSDIDRSMIDVPRKRTAPCRVILASTTLDEDDQHVDFNGAVSGGDAFLPLAKNVPGQDFTLVKTDASAFAVRFTGSGSDLISGQTNVELTDQWQTVTVRSVGSGYRQV